MLGYLTTITLTPHNPFESNPKVHSLGDVESLSRRGSITMQGSAHVWSCTRSNCVKRASARSCKWPKLSMRRFNNSTSKKFKTLTNYINSDNDILFKMICSILLLLSVCYSLYVCHLWEAWYEHNRVDSARTLRHVLRGELCGCVWPLVHVSRLWLRHHRTDLLVRHHSEPSNRRLCSD